MTADTERDALDMLAAEYALRLLDGDELDRAEALLKSDPSFSNAVQSWEMRLASFADEIEEVDAGTAAKKALMNRLFPDAAPTPLLERIGFWKWAAAASIAMAAVLALFTYNSADLNSGPLYTAQIVSEEGDFRVVAVVDKSSNEVFLTRTAGAAPEGRVLQVWAHGPDAPAVSVGLWPEGESIRLALPAVVASAEGTLTLGVSEEPLGGSPTGSPSGRVFGTVDIPNVVSAL